MGRISFSDSLTVAIVVMAIIVGYLYLNNHSPGSETDGVGLLETRLASVGASWAYTGAQFPQVNYRNVASGNIEEVPTTGTGIILVLGRVGCSPCQVRELRNLDTLRSKLPLSVDIAAIYYNDISQDEAYDRTSTLELLRAGHPSFPLGYTADPRLGDFMMRGAYPMIFILREGNVISSFAPVPEDDSFSYVYMQALAFGLGDQLGTPAPLEAEMQVTLGTDERRWQLRSPTGEEMVVADMLGKPTFINFWATWCAPCIEELPSLQSLFDTLPSGSVTWILATDDDPEVAQTFMEARGYTMPVYTYAGERPGIFESSAIPATYVINAEGTIIMKHVGAANWHDKNIATFIHNISTK
jgi:thiol-disulfide isomerase/thioredoxin